MRCMFKVEASLNRLIRVLGPKISDHKSSRVYQSQRADNIAIYSSKRSATPQHCSRQDKSWSISKLYVIYFELINRMRAVRALPSGTVKVPYCGESTLLLAITGFWLSVMFSITPLKPK